MKIPLRIMEIHGLSIVQQVSRASQKEEEIGKDPCTERIQLVLQHYEKVFHPNLFVRRGELGATPDKIFPYIKINTTLKPARFQQDRGLLGQQ